MKFSSILEIDSAPSKEITILDVAEGFWQVTSENHTGVLAQTAHADGEAFSSDLCFICI